MDWAKIEIEFPPSQHGPNEVMQFLIDHFRNPDGVPTAVITLVSVGGEREPDPEVVVGSNYIKWNTTSGLPPSSIRTGAEAIARALPQQKIHAIKMLRSAYNLSLVDAKNYMDDAYRDLGL